MTEPRKRTTGEVWQALEKIAADAELERIDALGDEELDRELRAAGIDPAEAAKVGQDLLGKAPKPTRPPRKVRRWVTWVAVAAVAALVAGALAKRRELAGRGPEPIGPDPEQGMLVKQAAKLRDDAFGACEQGLWGACADKLNAARALDPAGETAPRVLAARKAIYDVEHADAGHISDKPPMP